MSGTDDTLRKLESLTSALEDAFGSLTAGALAGRDHVIDTDSMIVLDAIRCAQRLADELDYLKRGGNATAASMFILLSPGGREALASDREIPDMVRALVRAPC